MKEAMSSCTRAVKMKAQTGTYELKDGNTRGIFVTIVFLPIVFFTDQTAVARMFLLLRTHMAAKLPIVYIAIVGSIAADHCHCYGGFFFFLPTTSHSGIGDTLEPRTHGVQFADDRFNVRVCNALSYHG